MPPSLNHRHLAARHPATVTRALVAAGALTVACALAVAGCSTQAASPAAASSSAAASPTSALPALSHIFIILMENESGRQIIGNPGAPFINGLADHYSLATNY